MRIQCCICADLFSEDTDIAAIQCGHVFHEHCLARWMTTANTCPSCRKRIKPNCVISKLFFDIAERFGNLSSEDISARNQKLQEELAESKRDSHECKEETKKLRSQFEKQNDELQSLRLLLHHAHDKEEAQDSLLKHHEMQRKQYEVERGNFLCAEAKLKDLKSVEIVLSGCRDESEQLFQQYNPSDRTGVRQLCLCAAVLKKEYESVKAEKTCLKHELHLSKKKQQVSSTQAAELLRRCQALQEHLARSEDDLKLAERRCSKLKKQVNLRNHTCKHPASSAGSFIQTPSTTHCSISSRCVTPGVASSPPVYQVGTIDLTEKSMDATPVDESNTQCNINDISSDLFDCSAHVQVSVGNQHNKVELEASSAVNESNAGRQHDVERPGDVCHWPLLSMNIMRKRDRSRCLRSAIRRDYNGLGGTSTHSVALGAQSYRENMPVPAKKKTASIKSLHNPPLPKLDISVDLTKK